MKNWQKIDRKNRDFEVTLKNGDKLWGSFPLADDEDIFGHETVGFLSWEKKESFFKAIQGKANITIDEILQFVAPIPHDSIESMTESEKSIGGISLIGNKPIPDGLQLRVHNYGQPGFVRITYKTPGNHKEFEIGELKIVNGEVTLPLKLAFVSYAREDQAVVKEIIKELNDHGVLTWFDENELMPGDHWERKIEEAIEKSENVIVFFSGKTLERSGYKNKEIRYILDQAKYRPLGARYIIPVLLDDCKPPHEFKELHWLSHGRSGWLEKLVNVLK